MQKTENYLKSKVTNWLYDKIRLKRRSGYDELYFSIKAFTLITKNGYNAWLL